MEMTHPSDRCAGNRRPAQAQPAAAGLHLLQQPEIVAALRRLIEAGQLDAEDAV